MKIKPVLDKLYEGLSTLSALCFFTIFAVNIVNIICRTLFGFSLLWSGDLSMLLVSWTMCLAMAAAIYKGDHLIVSFLVDLMPPRRKLLCALLTRVILLGVCLLLLVEGIVVTQLRIGILYVSLRVPTAYAFAALPVFAAFSSLFLLCHIYETAQSLRKGATAK